ncbi:hypothetical protein TNCV_718921 [Trichonephila clavipes]|nr:hypothetical protein TNCV_718921 [Trichonephila clavipes]
MALKTHRIQELVHIKSIEAQSLQHRRGVEVWRMGCPFRLSMEWMHNKPVSLPCDAMPSSVQFLGQHFGDKLLVTKGRMTHGDLEGCLGVELFELAIFGFEVHVLRALGGCDEKNPYSVFNLSISISGATEGSVIVSCPSVQIPRPGPKRHVALLVPQVHSPTCSTAGHKGRSRAEIRSR